MSFQTTALKYGWVYLTALGVVTGTTIYVLNNTRQQVKPEDIIEIVLGTYERCLATQTSTNPTYSVTPPSFVRSWVKTNARTVVWYYEWARHVCYTSYWPSTTGVGEVYDFWLPPYDPHSFNYAESWTATDGYVWVTQSVWPSVTVTGTYETVTNAIGWHPDHDMMVSLDTTIKALVPYYVDTNTVYDGTTNIVMLTVTGLWASLSIGDGTNKFTRTPAIGTNAATYGDYPWQIYVEDLQERYKALEALKMTAPSDYSMVATNQIGGFAHNHSATNVSVWAALKASIDTNMAGPPTAFIGTFTFATATSAHEPNTGIWAEPDAWKQVWKDSTFSWSNITVLDGTMFWFVSMTNMTGDDFGVPYVTNNFVTGYDANGIPNPLNGQLYIWGEEVVAASNGVIFSVNLSSDATWCVAPSWDTGWTHWNWRIPFPSDPYVTLVSTRGCKLREHKAVFQPTFLYCVDKYW